MADDNPSTSVPMNPAIPQDNQLSPPLQYTLGQFSTDDGRSAAFDAASRVQQHLNEINTVDANTAGGAHLERTVQGITKSLADMATADPTSTQLGIDLAPQTLAPLLMHADLGTSSEIVADAQRQIAVNGVMRAADLHADTAHGMANQFGDYIGVENLPNLHNYIDTMDAARNADGKAAQQQQAQTQQVNSNIAAYKFGSSLLDPRTEDVAFPKDYLQNLVRNNNINPDDKMPLFTAFSNLQDKGDVHVSDPYAVAKVLQDISDPRTNVTHDNIMSHVGDDIRYVDALMLHGMNLQRTPEGEAHARQLSQTLNDAQSTLASTGDRAGNVAYSRFVNWLLPAYRRSGMAGLDPNSDNYLFKNGPPTAGFQANAADAVAPFNPATRRPLAEIMGGKRGGNA